LMDQIKLLDKKYSLGQCNDLRNNILPRLEYNFNLVWHLCDQQDDIFKNIVEQINAN